MTNNDLDLVRSKAEEVVKLARSNPDFARQLTDDPEAALRGMGMPEWAIEHTAGEFRFPGEDVSGYRRCDMMSCIITICSYWTEW